MRSQDKVPYLGALSLLMSLAELFIPRPLPFFRLGLANIPILMGLDLDIRSFMVLLAVKAIGNSYISGTVFSLFFIMSILQTFASGAVMFAAKNIVRNISIYSVSLLGAAASTMVQIALASLYAGRGVMLFLPLMLIIALPSSLLVAYASGRIEMPESLPEIENEGQKRKKALPAIALIICAGCALMIQSIPLLLAALLVSFMLQRMCRRKILILPHVLTLAFMVISSLLTPEGQVIAHIFSFPITEGAIISGISKALSLSVTMSLSQSFSAQLSFSSGLIGKTLCIFSNIETAFRSASGTLNERVAGALKLEVHNKQEKQPINITAFTLILISIVFLLLYLLDYLIF